jgi:peptide/nickel transport system permease protein
MNRLLRQFTNEFNLNLVVGLFLLLSLILYSIVGTLVIDKSRANVGAFAPRLEPNWENLLGTDTQGRDVFAILTHATPKTLMIGLIAGLVGIIIGSVLGIIAGYFRGAADTIIRILTDVFITIPGIAILVVVATNLRIMSVGLIALIVASLAWRFPARSIRSQTLSLRERAYVEIARLNGVGELEIVLKEILPNLLPYIAASFVATVSASILATIGLEALGLGPQNEYTLGMMLYWAKYYGAILRGFWWWWLPPIIVIILIFVSLLFISAGMDQIVNTKLRSQA